MPWVKVKEPEPIISNEMLLEIPYNRTIIRKLKKIRRCKYLKYLPVKPNRKHLYKKTEG